MPGGRGDRIVGVDAGDSGPAAHDGADHALGPGGVEADVGASVAI